MEARSILEDFDKQFGFDSLAGDELNDNTSVATQLNTDYDLSRLISDNEEFIFGMPKIDIPPQPSGTKSPEQKDSFSLNLQTNSRIPPTLDDIPNIEKYKPLSPVEIISEYNEIIKESNLGSSLPEKSRDYSDEELFPQNGNSSPKNSHRIDSEKKINMDALSQQLSLLKRERVVNSDTIVKLEDENQKLKNKLQRLEKSELEFGALAEKVDSLMQKYMEGEQERILQTEEIQQLRREVKELKQKYS